PLAMTALYSLSDYDAIKPLAWVGLGNYSRLMADDRFWVAVKNTLYFTVTSVPARLALALFLAMLLSLKVRGQAVYRTVFFLPTIVPLVVSAVLWMWVFNAQSGLLNGALQQIGIDNPPGWLADRAWAKPALVLMSLWGIGGSMVIFLAGLADVPQSLYEVADLDGAGPLSKFRHVTLPMISPVILFNLVIGLINGFQYFTEVYVMTNGRGDPADSTLFYALYLYRTAFYYLQLGYASAMAWIMFVVILGATLAVLASSKRWVHYHAD
ncbi:MAG: sugar ABC transporter permease, partial [Candidatus Hydrogenedentales bacterium]